MKNTSVYVLLTVWLIIGILFIQNTAVLADSKSISLSAGDSATVKCDTMLAITSQDTKQIKVTCAPKATRTPTASKTTQRTATPASTQTASPTSTATATVQIPTVQPTTGFTAVATTVPTTTTSVTYYVTTNGSDTNTGTTPASAFKTLQHALDVAQSGTTIMLADGTYTENVITKRDRVTITGSQNARLVGSSSNSGRAIEINHSGIVLQGFTIDGKRSSGFKDKLVYVQNKKAQTPLTGLHITGMTIGNAGGECVRLRYYIQGAEIDHTTIFNCGQDDFPNGVYAGGTKNGEGIYLGTAPEQRSDGKNPDASVDISRDNRIHDNLIETHGNECVDIKEGATANLVYSNTCRYQSDSESGGFDSRGSGNSFYDNLIENSIGAGIRLGGDTTTDGTHNNIYRNTIRNNKNGGIKFQRTPQDTVCGNTMDTNTGGTSVGTYGSQYDPTKPCNT